jgi:hypothetical protein
MRGRFSIVLAAMIASVLPVAGQTVRSRPANVELAHSGPLPYTAEFKITSVKVLSDGSTITRESTELVAVDSQGRRMTATTIVPVSADQTAKTTVHVFDPQARTNLSWSVPGEKATVTAMPEPGTVRSSCPASTGPRAAQPLPQHEKPTVEDLGTETIQGVEARGHRTTIVTPAGAIGNNDPLTRTTEVWMSFTRGLNGLIAREITDDPQTGKRSRELTSFTQAEPDASLFQPPANYEVVTRETPLSACAAVPLVEAPPSPAQ